MIEIPKERLDRFEGVTLLNGAHDSIDEGGCVMEWAAFLAGREHSDSPPCVSPVIGAFLRNWNDNLDDDARQQLKPYAAKVLGTAGTPEQEEIRAWMAVDWSVRVSAPAWMELAGLKEHADKLRALGEIRDAASMEAGMPTLKAAREARAAAWDAARAAARDAAGAAAWAAARAAAWDAAWDAAGGKLAPTVKSLQADAHKLLERMIAVTGDLATNERGTT